MNLNNKLDWKECFGSGRQYTLLMVKSQSEPMRFAAKLAKLYQRNFSFIDDYVPVPDLRPDVAFATYFSIIDAVKNINMLVMANHTPMPASAKSNHSNSLVGIPLFDEENFYFFNNRTDNRLFKCSQKNFDYLIILYSNRDTSTTDVTDVLMNQNSFMTEDVSDFLRNDDQQRGAQKRISVLQNLIEYFGVKINNILENRARERFGDKNIPMSNYVQHRYLIQQVISSPLMDREDV